MAARTDSSVAGSTVITNGRSRQLALGKLQHRVDRNILGRQRRRQLRDDPRPVLHAESQIIRRAVQRHRNRLVLAQPRMRERRHPLRTAASESRAPRASDR